MHSEARASKLGRAHYVKATDKSPWLLHPTPWDMPVCFVSHPFLRCEDMTALRLEQI